MRCYALSRQISFRTLGDLAVLVDHRRQEILRLNRAAGEVLERIDSGATDLCEDEVDFAEQLVELGLAQRVAGEDPRPSSEASEQPASSTAPEASGTQPASSISPEATKSDLLDRINRETARATVPLHAQLEVTYRCPLSCSYCYLGAERSGSEPELTAPEIARLLDELAALGSMFLLLTGGEPLVRRDLESIIDHARSKRFAVSLLTSGWSMDPAMMRRLAAAGLDSVQISLHGADPATHDARTGVAGSFAQALSALRWVRDQGVRTLAAITVTKRNLSSLGSLRELVASEGVTAHVSYYVQRERAGSREPQLDLLDEAGLRRAYQVFPPGRQARLGDRELEDPPCGAGANTVAIDPFGAVYPCQALRWPVGSIRQQRLTEIWARSPRLLELRALRVADLAACPTCAHRRHCNRCTGSALGEGLDYRDHAPFDCLQARVVSS